MREDRRVCKEIVTISKIASLIYCGDNEDEEEEEKKYDEEEEPVRTACAFECARDI